MPLRGKTAADEAASKKAAETFERIANQKKALNEYTKTTEAIAARIPVGEKERLRGVFGKSGFTLAEAMKIGLYRFADDLENGIINLLDAKQTQARHESISK